MGYIYKITCSQSDKVYIGQTTNTIENRFKEHWKQARNGTVSHLYNAMRKYGVKNFSIEEIEKCNNEQLNEKEIYWINYFDSYNSGYNMTIGGDGRTKYNYKEIADKYLELQSEKETAQYFNCSKVIVQKACQCYNIEIKRGLSEDYWNSEKGQKHKEQTRQLGLASKGRVVSEKTRKKQSEAKKGMYIGEKNPMYGKKFTEEHRKKMSQNSAWAKKVICVETGEVYSSALQASKAVGLKSSAGLSKCCNGERKTAGGFHWMYVKEGENNY